VNLHVEPSGLRSSFDQCLEAPNRKRRTPFAHKQKNHVIGDTKTERPQSWRFRRSGSLARAGHLVPPRSWGGGVDGACKTYVIRFA
jgi:hypothetical protein